jgi:hypothetical protein
VYIKDRFLKTWNGAQRSSLMPLKTLNNPINKANHNGFCYQQ